MVQILSDARTCKQSMHLRWLQVEGTTTSPPRLQQAWVCLETGELEWKDVELVVQPSDAALNPYGNTPQQTGITQLRLTAKL